MIQKKKIAENGYCRIIDIDQFNVLQNRFVRFLSKERLQTRHIEILAEQVVPFNVLKNIFAQRPLENPNISLEFAGKDIDSRFLVTSFASFKLIMHSQRNKSHENNALKIT